jgi:polyribonucleotide nucleotidyltransferase
MIHREVIQIGGRDLVIETGRVARQAHGSALVQFGETMVLVTATAAKTAREGVDFLPLTCDYIEKTFAAGKIPGGFFKREGRPTEKETLTSRLVDRPCRPLFPKGWSFETQVIATVMSADPENNPDVIALCGAGAALELSDIPFGGPVGGVRVGRVGGEFVANPTFEQMEESDLDIVMAATRDAIVMVEGSAAVVPEEVMLNALEFGHQALRPFFDALDRMRARAGKPKREFVRKAADTAVEERVSALALGRLKEALALRAKHDRYGALDQVKSWLMETLCAEKDGAPAELAGREAEVAAAFENLKKKVMRAAVLGERRRIDGRALDEIREITCEISTLPRTHGSALFTRGETQAMVTTTLGTSQDEQRIDGLIEETFKSFMLHYNFPPYSVGEVKFLRAPSRREIGHGALAERAVSRMIPPEEKFPYTIRIVSEILESNGSSSMATVCGATLSLMDAGVPIKAPVAGIAMGLIKEGDEVAVLSDILGDEDHLGDMDFKVCGTREGITALQMDIKIGGLSREIMERALYQAREGRIFVLDKMAETIPEPRKELKQHAPRIITLQIKPERIRDVIGPGGRTIKGIIEETGVSIDVEDDGKVSIASTNEDAANKAVKIIRSLTREAEVGEFYLGTVKRITEFGAFVEILPGVDGLVHISELAKERVRKVTDVVQEGDELLVKVINIDRDGKIRLSRKEALGVKLEDYL